MGLLGDISGLGKLSRLLPSLYSLYGHCSAVWVWSLWILFANNFMISLSLSLSLSQVEKLRHAFLSVFPFPNAPPQGVVQTTSYGYSSFPMRTCRRQHHNQYPHSDPAPPTPPVSTHTHTHTYTHTHKHAFFIDITFTSLYLSLSLQGLIARGDHRGSLVEKDDSVDQSNDTQQVTYKAVKGTSESHDSHMTNPHHQLVVPASGHQSFTHTPPSSHLSSGSMYESSRPLLTTSDYSSSKSLPQYGVQMPPHSSASRQTSSTGFSSSHTGLSGLSGEGTMHHAPPMVTAPTSLIAYPYHSRSSPGQLSSMPRPSSLSVGVQRSTMAPSQHHKVLNQQKFECPSCRKQFTYGPQEFNQWFEHIRYCENKP